MKKQFLLLASALLMSLMPAVVIAQGLSCGSDGMRQKLAAEHPEILQEEAEQEAFTQSFVADYFKNHDARSGPYIIPIVFHIIHQGGPENISDAQVIDQVRILNDDYNKRNADTADVIPIFKSIIANVGIEFRLANIDPWGRCTNGIDRVNSCQTFSGNDYSKLNGWPREKYLNVWVVSRMENGVAGYAYYPGSVSAIYNFPDRDGVIILSDYIGSIGTSSAYTSRALTHEIGHYLNLKHPWGDTNSPGISCGDDNVDDTPITRGSTSCNLGLNYCVPGTIENVQNYMDYSYCSKMFTEDQKIRMLAALESDKADRNNLYTQANLVATGTDDLTYNDCAPVADFNASKRYICVGDNVTMRDCSFNGSVDTYFWEFPNGTPSTSTAQNPNVQFLVAGWQPVKLTITNALGTSTKTNNELVYVSYGNALLPAPYYEDFETPGKINENEWASVNVDNDQTAFRQVDIASHTGSRSMQVDNYYTHADHDIDELISPGIDLSQLTNSQMTLSFYYSLASWNQSFIDLADSIAVLASTNCGGNWVNIYKKGGSAIVNAGYQAGYFVPTQAWAYWKQVKINLPATLKQPNVHFKFQLFSAVKGNNFYIDDINIGGVATGLEEIEAVQNVQLFPNPAADATQLNLSLTSAQQVSVKLFDITGKEVADVLNDRLTEGDHIISINNLSSYTSGIYTVSITAGNARINQKLVIQ